MSVVIRKPSSDHTAEVVALSREILDNITQRRLVEAQRLLDIVFSKFDVMQWIGGEPGDVARVLDALGRALSRNCRWREDLPDEPCKFMLLDGALGRPEGFTPDDHGFLHHTIADLDLETVARFGMYRGISTLHRRRYEDAGKEFGAVERDARRLKNRDLQMVARFYLSVCARRTGGCLADVRRHLKSAYDLAASDPATEAMAAAISVHIAWLNCSDGRFEGVADMLEKAQRILGTASDHAAIAHAKSLEARLARRRCDYATAKTLIEQAITGYTLLSERHRALARCHANLALTEILLSEEADSTDACQKHLDDARTALDEADRIFRARHYANDSRPEVDNLRALIAHHRGQFDTAIDIADRSYEEALARHDHVEMSTARIIKCRAILDRTGARGAVGSPLPEALVKDYHLARACADEAEMAAKRIEGKHGRRAARAFIWKGFVALRPPFLNVDFADSCADQAYDLLPEPKDEAGYVSTELQLLERTIADFCTSNFTFPYHFSISPLDLQNTSRKALNELLDEFIVCVTAWNYQTSREVYQQLEMPKRAYEAAVERCKEKNLILPEALHAKKGGRKREDKRSRFDKLL